MPPREHVRVVGTDADFALRDFLVRIDQPYEWVDADGTEGSAPVVDVDGQRVDGRSLVAAAVGEGSAAVEQAHRYLALR